jgi:hypothetical protein
MNTIVSYCILFLVILGLCVVHLILYRIQFQAGEKLMEIKYLIDELAEMVARKSL